MDIYTERRDVASDISKPPVHVHGSDAKHELYIHGSGDQLDGRRWNVRIVRIGPDFAGRTDEPAHERNHTCGNYAQLDSTRQRCCVIHCVWYWRNDRFRSCRNIDDIFWLDGRKLVRSFYNSIVQCNWRRWFSFDSISCEHAPTGCYRFHGNSWRVDDTNDSTYMDSRKRCDRVHDHVHRRYTAKRVCRCRDDQSDYRLVNIRRYIQFHNHVDERKRKR